MSCCDKAYYCPRSDAVECKSHGEYDYCCDRPEIHRYLEASVSLTPEEKKASIAARRERKRLADDTCATLAYKQVYAKTPEAKEQLGLLYRLAGCQKSPRWTPPKEYLT